MKQKVDAGRDANVAGRDLTINNYYRNKGSREQHGNFTGRSRRAKRSGLNNFQLLRHPPARSTRSGPG